MYPVLFIIIGEKTLSETKSKGRYKSCLCPRTNWGKVARSLGSQGFSHDEEEEEQEELDEQLLLLEEQSELELQEEVSQLLQEGLAG